MGFRDDIYLSPRGCVEMAKEAARNKMWINYGKDWYTPEEFVNLSRAIDVNGNTKFEYEKVKISDPVIVINRMQQLVRDRFVELDELQKKVNDFAIRVAEYYKGS